MGQMFLLKFIENFGYRVYSTKELILMIHQSYFEIIREPFFQLSLIIIHGLFFQQYCIELCSQLFYIIILIHLDQQHLCHENLALFEISYDEAIFEFFTVMVYILISNIYNLESESQALKHLGIFIPRQQSLNRCGLFFLALYFCDSLNFAHEAL